MDLLANYGSDSEQSDDSNAATTVAVDVPSDADAQRKRGNDDAAGAAGKKQKLRSNNAMPKLPADFFVSMRGDVNDTAPRTAPPSDNAPAKKSMLPPQLLRKKANHSTMDEAEYDTATRRTKK